MPHPPEIATSRDGAHDLAQAGGGQCSADLITSGRTISLSRLRSFISCCSDFIGCATAKMAARKRDGRGRDWPLLFLQISVVQFGRCGLGGLSSVILTLLALIGSPRR